MYIVSGGGGMWREQNIGTIQIILDGIHTS